MNILKVNNIRFMRYIEYSVVEIPIEMEECGEEYFRY
jgi:hypothetical protein